MCQLWNKISSRGDIESLQRDNNCRPRRQEVSRSAGPALAQVVLLDVITEGSEAHAEELRRLHLHAAGTLQGLSNIVALDLLDVRLEIEAASRQGLAPRAVAWGGSPSQRGRQALRQHGGSGLERDCALDDVLQLADVARPIVDQQQLQ